MSPRLAPVVAASLTLLMLAGCSATSAADGKTVAPATPPGVALRTARPATPGATIAPAPSALASTLPAASPKARVRATPPPPTPRPAKPSAPRVTPRPTATAPTGDVDGGRIPELTIEFPAARVIDATIADPKARAWRFDVAGVKAAHGDRFEILVETSDMAMAISVREVRGGHVVATVDAAGATKPVCHPTLKVCLLPDALRLPHDGDGVMGVRLALPVGIRLTITGASAGWPSEPFVLGPWTTTEAFPWSGIAGG